MIRSRNSRTISARISAQRRNSKRTTRSKKRGLKGFREAPELRASLILSVLSLLLVVLAF